MRTLAAVVLLLSIYACEDELPPQVADSGGVADAGREGSDAGSSEPDADESDTDGGAPDAGEACPVEGACSGRGTCDDSTGAIVCTCDATYGGDDCESCAAGHQDHDENGTCTPTCEALSGGTSHEGRCDGCGTDRSSWEAARDRASAACFAAGCTDTCSTSIAAWDDCRFDGVSGGYVCVSWCGAEPTMVCAPDASCSDASGTAICI